MFSFSMFTKPSRESTTITFNPGIEVMEDLVKRKRVRARLPPVRSVQRAVEAYLDSKPVIPDTQAQLLLQSIQYILEDRAQSGTMQEPTQEESDITRLIWNISDSLVKQHETGLTDVHLELARLLHQEAMQTTQPALITTTSLTLIFTLCRLDQPLKARDLLNNQLDNKLLSHYLDKSYTENVSIGYAHKKRRFALLEILEAFAKQRNEVEVLATLDAGKSIALLDRQKTLRIMVEFYADRQEVQKLDEWLKRWLCWRQRFKKYEVISAPATILRAAFACYLETDQHDFGHRLVRELMITEQPKAVWDELIAWGFSLHKSVDEVNRMLDVMLESKYCEPPGSPTINRPDIATINRLIEVAIAAHDPYMAERLISLGQSRGIEPDAHTLVLQMQYRLSVNDIDGALIAYKHLQSKDLSANDDLPIVNKLIVALSQSARHDHETIMNVAADLSDRRAEFEPSTVKALAIVHLRRDELQDMQDLLKTHAQNFSSTDRTSLRAAIMELALDPKTSVATMWDAYHVLRNDFDEMPREERTQIMQSCFDRRRPDMAVHVFNHMRLHSREDTQPNISTYVTAFLGAASVRDGDALRALHNQLKLDTTIDVNTRLLNALMIAFTACDQAADALSTWRDILLSKEGPTYSSIHLAFRACEFSRFGDLEAPEIWARLIKNDVDLDQSLWTSYIAALAGNGAIGNAVATLEDALKKGQVELDTTLLGTLFNAAVRTGRGGHIARWASTEHPEAWEKLTKVDMKEDKFGLRVFDIDRSIKP